MSKRAKNVTKKAKTFYKPRENQKLAQLWKISTGGASATSNFFHLCADGPLSLCGSISKINDTNVQGVLALKCSFQYQLVQDQPPVC